MAKRVFIRDADIRAGGNRAALAVVGAGPEFRSVLGYMDADRREVVASVTPVDARYGYVPKPADINAGSRRVKDFKGDPAAWLKKNLPWAGKAIFTRAGDTGPRVDLVNELRIIRGWLMAAASPFARSGKYGRSFRFQVGSRLFQNIPGNFTIAGITNLAAYASTLENSQRHGIFRRVFTKVQARARRLGYDARYTFLTGVAEGSGSVPHYPAPVIQIGQLNSMRGLTGLQVRRRPVAGGRWMPPEGGWGWRRRDWRR